MMTNSEATDGPTREAHVPEVCYRRSTGREVSGLSITPLKAREGASRSVAVLTAPSRS